MATKVKLIADDAVGAAQIDSSASPQFTNLTLTGNLTVQGTTTTLDTTNLNVEDKNITLNYGTGDTSSSAGGAGITIQDGVNSSTDATLLWDASDDEFDFSHAINIPNLKVSGGQGTDGQLLTSTGSGIAWEDAPASGLPLSGGTLTGNLTMGGMILKPTADGGSIGFNRNPNNGSHVGNSSLRRFQLNGPGASSGDYWEFQSYDSSGSHQGNIRIQDGKLGIGLTPSATLDVNGNIRLDGNHPNGSQNVALGDGAYAVGTGSNNTIIGHDAGNDISSSNFNTVVGAFALDAQTSGGRNVAIGYAALSTDSTGGRSVAVGWNALGTQNLGSDDISYNVAIGYNAMGDSTYGLRNVAVGYETLDANTSGNDNTAVGQAALSSSTTADKNTAVGRAALNAVTSDNNVAVGYHALLNASTGTQNNAIGSNALADLTTGNYNVAIGQAALSDLVGGSSNTAVGDNAMQFGTANNYCVAVGENAGRYMTGSQNTALGCQAMDNSSCTSSNNTAVGYEAMGKLTSGGDNVSMGRAAALDLTTGASNTAIGVEAMENNSGGHENSCFGKHAGRNLTSGSSNTLIGHSVNPSSGSSSNANGLGYSLTCQDNYTTIGQGSSDIRAAHGSTSWATISDLRVKKDIEDSTVGLAFINDLRPVTFNYKNRGDIPESFNGYVAGSTDAYNSSLTQHGFIAQEVKAAIDKHSDIKDGFDMWDDDDSTGQQRVAESALIPMLVKAIQELKTELDAAKARITTLEG